MNFGDIIVVAFLSLGGLFIFWVVAYFASRLIWLFNPFFILVNYIIWVLWNPFRFVAKTNSKFLFIMNRILLFTGIKFMWGLFIYIVTFIPRFILALYYDLLLYWSLAFEQSVRDMAMPKNWRYRSSGWFKYLIMWAIYFPYRIFIFTLKNIVIFFDGLLMAIVSTAFPTFTMYHGTNFRDGAVPITQGGSWKVGDGNYAGSGLYFGIERRVAEHYARGKSEPVVILVRVTLSPMRLGSTLHPRDYALVGEMREKGSELSRRMIGFYRTHEHWRKDNSWWEYCLLSPDRGSFVRSWRVRPVAVMDHETRVGLAGLRYIWNGMYHYAYIPGAWAAAIFGIGLLYVLVVVFGALAK